MNHKRLLIIAFILVALAQLFVPFRMMSKQANLAKGGTEFYFKIRNNQSDSSLKGNAGSSVMGKNIWLQFEADSFKLTDKKDWDFRRNAFVSFTKDRFGFAMVVSVTQKKPGTGSDWVKAGAYRAGKDSGIIRLSYPFKNYTIEDNNTKEFDSIFSKALNNPKSNLYLKINIRENQFIVNDLFIDSLSFKEFVRKAINKHN